MFQYEVTAIPRFSDEDAMLDEGLALTSQAMSDLSDLMELCRRQYPFEESEIPIRIVKLFYMAFEAGRHTPLVMEKPKADDPRSTDTPAKAVV